MIYSTYRPPAPAPPPSEHAHLDRGYASYAAPQSMASTSSMSASADRFEHRTHTLIASLLESRLSAHALVRDCAVIGIPQPGGIVTTSTPAHAPCVGTVPVAFVALSASGRERSAHGGEKESKRMKLELVKWLVDFAPPFKPMKGKLMFLDSIPRGASGSLLRHLLVDKATTPPAPGPDKGFFNTVLADPTVGSVGASRAGSTTHDDAPATTAVGAPKKAVRDSKRRATHSQIERRRREKINDRLVTLRSIVPACARELAERRRQKQHDDDEAARIAAGGTPKTYIDAATGKPKRKRNRKRAEAKKPTVGAGGEEELGLHKLEVLTHAINYIFELKAQIHRLETGNLPEHVPTADNPFGVRNADGSFRTDAKLEDEPGQGVLPHSGSVERKMKREDEEEEEDEIEDEAEEAEDGEDVEGDDEQDGSDEDEPLQRRFKKHMASAACSQPAPASGAMRRYARRETAYSSSSSRTSADVSPAFSLVQASPGSALSPATTLTSPMMSLSAESPILLPDSALPTYASKRTPSFPVLPSSALPLPAATTQAAGRRESSSFLFKHLSLASPNFPAYPHATRRTYGEESEVRATPGLADASDANAAQLLLNFSTSPEIVRPPRGLASPPLLALDSPTRRNDDDALSDKTIDDPPADITA